MWSIFARCLEDRLTFNWCLVSKCHEYFLMESINRLPGGGRPLGNNRRVGMDSINRVNRETSLPLNPKTKRMPRYRFSSLGSGNQTIWPSNSWWLLPGSNFVRKRCSRRDSAAKRCHQACLPVPPLGLKSHKTRVQVPRNANQSINRPNTWQLSNNGSIKQSTQPEFNQTIDPTRVQSTNQPNQSSIKQVQLENPYLCEDGLFHSTPSVEHSSEVRGRNDSDVRDQRNYESKQMQPENLRKFSHSVAESKLVLSAPHTHRQRHSSTQSGL